MKKYVIVLLLSIINCQLSISQIGTWHNYLAYHDVQQIQAAANDIFVMASNGLYKYNTQDQSIQTYDKTNGLNDTDISNIKWCQQAKRLVVTYSNSNIDLVETNGNIINISDLYTKVITGDKTIYHITISNQFAYLSTGFGILKLNVKDAVISETYILDFAVKAIVLSDGYIYAQAADGLVWMGSTTTNLIDKANWQQTASYPSFEEDKTDWNTYYPIVSTLTPDGPKYNYFGFMKFYQGKLYTCGGGYSASAELGRAGTIQVLDNNHEWKIYEDDLGTKTNIHYEDVLWLDIDPTDENHVMAGAKAGVYEFYNGNFVTHHGIETNVLQSALDDNNKNYVLVESVIFDSEGNLWALNSQALSSSIAKYTKNKVWESYHSSSLMYRNRSLQALTNLMIDHQGYMWFTNTHWNIPSLMRYDLNNHQLLNFFKTFTNQDGTTLNDYAPQCIKEDKNHNLWIGTQEGPIVLERAQLEESEPIFTQVKVPRNDGTNYADYLLSHVNISCIDIDGGNRKWIGTKGNGIFVISNDNMVQEHHFTESNSRLLSDNIESIAIDNTTGEVFIGTDKGLCSYMNEAVTPADEMTKDNVYAYPNPITPDYTGLITITGLTFDSNVKILSANGKLISQGRSIGGTYTWDGCDSKGNKVASGVYMVATATSDGNKGTVCKIAIVR